MVEQKEESVAPYLIYIQKEIWRIMFIGIAYLEAKLFKSLSPFVRCTGRRKSLQMTVVPTVVRNLAVYPRDLYSHKGAATG